MRLKQAVLIVGVVLVFMTTMRTVEWTGVFGHIDWADRWIMSLAHFAGR
jgi:hypothetical protein